MVKTLESNSPVCFNVNTLTRTDKRISVPAMMHEPLARNHMKKLMMSVVLAAGFLRTAQGQNLLVANLASGTIGEYSASGALINPSFISGLRGPAGMGGA